MQLFGNLLFVADKDGKIGSHSLKKYISGRVRRTGDCTRDNLDHRGRWKAEDNQHVSEDIYVDNEKPFIDAKVAGLACPSGPVGYFIRNWSPVTNDWILEHVTPAIAAQPSSLRLRDGSSSWQGFALALAFPTF